MRGVLVGFVFRVKARERNGFHMFVTPISTQRKVLELLCAPEPL